MKILPFSHSLVFDYDASDILNYYILVLFLGCWKLIIYLSNVGTTDQTGRICESDALDCQAGSISSKTSKKVTVRALQNYRLVLAKNRFSGGIREDLIGGIRKR
uniref:Uncharacterized protein n=1 Tax=Ananas comosus var. bracteatus TaxID=296719 RepID=A0A6V7PH04_ANACO|nr:unnamed protein product [Ananas comosus var. bracteatus]